MASGKTHNEHIASLFCCLNLNSQLIEAIQDAVYLLLDATLRDKDGPRISKSIAWLKNIGIKILPEDIVAPESNPRNHQYYAHRAWNFDYTTEGLKELEIDMPSNGDEKKQKEKEALTASWQKRYDLGKQILIKTIEYAFPSLEKNRAEAVARVCYCTHILGDLRYNETLDYLMDIPQCKNELLSALKLFGEDTRSLQEKISLELKNIVFDKSWNHCEPVDKTLELLFKDFCPSLKKVMSYGQG